jgi:hypothetical protein
LLLIQFFNGLSGIVGDYLLMKDPSGTGLQMPLEWLNDTPFTNYLVPGKVLFVFNGFGNLGGSHATLLKYRRSGETATLFGAILMIWIVSQVGWIEYQSGLQP